MCSDEYSCNSSTVTMSSVQMNSNMYEMMNKYSVWDSNTSDDNTIVVYWDVR